MLGKLNWSPVFLTLAILFGVTGVSWGAENLVFRSIEENFRLLYPETWVVKKGRGANVKAKVVAEDGSWARAGLADLIVGSFGPDGASRWIGVRSDKTIVGLAGDGSAALVIELEADETPGIAATDLDGDGKDELLVSVRERGVATIQLEMP